MWASLIGSSELLSMKTLARYFLVRTRREMSIGTRTYKFICNIEALHLPEQHKTKHQFAHSFDVDIQYPHNISRSSLMAVKVLSQNCLNGYSLEVKYCLTLRERRVDVLGEVTPNPSVQVRVSLNDREIGREAGRETNSVDFIELAAA